MTRPGTHERHAIAAAQAAGLRAFVVRVTYRAEGATVEIVAGDAPPAERDPAKEWLAENGAD